MFEILLLWQLSARRRVAHESTKPNRLEKWIVDLLTPLERSSHTEIIPSEF
jgi:hypothetical protein